MVLKVFLNRHPPEKARALERFLPAKERVLLETLPTLAEAVIAEPLTDNGLLEKVHWSWFLPTLNQYVSAEQKLFLSALSPYAAQKLTAALKITSQPSYEATQVARPFLRQTLLHSLTGYTDRLLPINYLPPSSLTPLLHQSKKELIQLINSLSIYDLAAELRQIVETKILKKIYSFLSEGERKLLQALGARKEHFVLTRMSLSTWDGTEESFRMLLHRRGLARLGVALSGQDPDFIWYICHQLDIGRGNALFKLCAKEATHSVSDAIIRQILDLT